MVLGLTLDKGASNATQFQALPRPQQKLHLFAAHEEGIGPVPLTLRDHPLADVAPTHYYITEVSHPVALKGRNTIG